MLCDYGCGQQAIHQFKNGKWCCSIKYQHCPNIKKNISKKMKGKVSPNKGKKFSKNHKNKLSESHKGYKMTNDHKLKISIANKGKVSGMKGRKHSEETKLKISTTLLNGKSYWNNKTFSKEHKLKISESNKGKVISDRQKKIISAANKGKNNKMYGKVFSSKMKKEMSIVRIMSISQIQKKYSTFAIVEEMRYNPDKPGEKEIQVHCKNHFCPNSKEQDGWFTPNKDSFYSRIYAIEHLDGNDARYLYCSNDCKDECPLYNKRVSSLIKEDQIRTGNIEDPWYNSSEYKTWRSKVFELDDNKCVYCEKKATIAHHILPQKTHPELSLDPENGLSVCQKCHYKYGHQEGCSTGNLSKLLCKRIIKIKKE